MMTKHIQQKHKKYIILGIVLVIIGILVAVQLFGSSHPTLWLPGPPGELGPHGQLVYNVTTENVF